MRVIDKLGLLHIANRRLLVARSRNKTQFYVPGGKRDEGESDIDALCREVEEELATTLQPDSIRPAGVFQAQADGQPTGINVKVTAYFGTPAANPKPSAEIAELAWFSFRDADRMSLTGQLILQELQARGLID